MNFNIGIEQSKRKEVMESLSRILADSYVLYAKTQVFHWNVTGPAFHSLHELFETQYRNLAEAIDAVAERIRALGYPAPAGLADFLKLSHLREINGTPLANDMIQELNADHERLIQTLRAAIEVADNAQDYATSDLLTDRLGEHEKACWMLRSHMIVDEATELKEAV